MDDELDITKLKYVLYARKSTTDETRQVRSIPDQIFECKQLSARIGIRVVQVLQETKSAKKPHQRPIFTKMINDIKAGLYDCILAWNPDRLARNMLEGGMVIDLIDQDIIKDLKFVTHTFTKDANGKMLLGMAFVLSKQYSDDLSQKVTRGVRRKFGEGKSQIPKHGYLNDDSRYKPDGKNFDLICEAWQQRIAGKSIEDITEYLKSSDYARTVKTSGKQIDMSKQILSKIFHDPFYYGVLIQAGQEVDLKELDRDFIPAVSKEDYFAVQDLQYRRIKPSKPHKVAFYPFRQMVQCAYCDRFMQVAPSSGKTKKYLYFRCDNEDCKRQKRSIRSKVVVNFIYNLLRNGLNFTEAEYKEYLNGITTISDQKRQTIRRELHNKQGVLKHITSDIKERSLKIVNYDTTSRVWQENTDKIVQLELDEKKLTNEITKLKAKLTDPETDRLSIEQFLNLSKNAERIVQSADERLKDFICRIIFLNFCVDEEKVASYRLKEPFATLLKQRQLRTSRGAGN